MLWSCMAVFLFGAIFEAACVGWTHFSEKGYPVRSALFSVVIATTNVFGLGESIRDYRAAPFFIAGYAVGTFLAVKWKNLKF